MSYENWAADLAGRIAGEPAMSHTTDLLVSVGRRPVLVRHWKAPGLRQGFSMTKSVLALLVGTAVADRLVDLDEQVHDGATVRHLLTMTRGVAADPLDIDDVIDHATDWEAAIKAEARAWPPGERFCYDNGAAHLLSCWLERRAGPLADLARARLGLDEVVWETDPQGHARGFDGLHLRPEAWRGLGERCLAPDPWVAEMTRPHTSGGPPEGAAYGYLTWVTDDGFFFGGWAGQSVTVLPRPALVVVTLGDPERLRPGWRSAREAVVDALASLPGC